MQQTQHVKSQESSPQQQETVTPENVKQCQITEKDDDDRTVSAVSDEENENEESQNTIKSGKILGKRKFQKIKQQVIDTLDLMEEEQLDLVDIRFNFFDKSLGMTFHNLLKEKKD